MRSPRTASPDLNGCLTKLALAATTGPALILLAAVLSSWPLMLGLGIIHAQITPRVPALGFWSTLGLSWALGALIGKFRSVDKLPRKGTTDA